MSTRLLDYKTASLQDYKTTRLQVYKTTRLQDYKSTRLLDYKSTRLLDYKSTSLRDYNFTSLHIVLNLSIIYRISHLSSWETANYCCNFQTVIYSQLTKYYQQRGNISSILFRIRGKWSLELVQIFDYTIICQPLQSDMFIYIVVVGL